MGRIVVALVDARDYAPADAGIVAVAVLVAADAVVHALLAVGQVAPGSALAAGQVAMPDARLLAQGDAGMMAARAIVLQLAGWIALVDAAVDAALAVDVVAVLAVVLHAQMVLGLIKFV